MTGRGTRLKIAVVLFNLGGPDCLDAVEPFLFNLFNDRAIIGAPQPIRWLIAKLISARRAPIARKIYDHMGGRSPILPATFAQARALEAQLAPKFNAKCFISMRYWHPRADETVAQVKAWAPDEIILLPLYPHYSSTTTGSSLKDWQVAARRAGLDHPSHIVCCYPTADKFIAAHAELLRMALDTLSREQPDRPVRLLLSAHGLPKRVIDRGDPYQAQVEQTCAAVVAALGVSALDWVTCYQSRVGPLEWIGPATDAEIERAGRDGKALIVAPIAFVSEHSETLVELDIEYRHLALVAGVPAYVRVPALGCEPGFIAALADLVCAGLDREVLCPDEAAGSPCVA